jgi:signal transduction histidine kinase
MWFSNNNSIGYIFLDAETSSSLTEKTNREGFVENEAYLSFYMVLKAILREFAATRFSDRTKWLKFNQKSTSNLFDSKVSAFKELLESYDLSNDEKKKKLLEEAEKLEEKYEEDKKILLIPAGVGMTASVALHEIEKLVPRMEETIKSEPFKKEIISEQVDELRQYTDGIISVLRKGGDKPIDIKESINRAFNNYKLKLSNRNISYIIEIADDITIMNCDKRFFITMLMNIIDNSIYWLETVYKEEKSIFLKCSKVENVISIIIADNGPGFKDDISELIRPFFTRKSDGIGIGMYLIDTIMLKYGKLDIISPGNESIELGIPIKFDGAIVRLVFNKNQ